MELVIIWMIIAIICALVAGHKNRSRGGWFLAGFVFSLIALAILACLGSLPSVEDKPTAA